MARLHLMMGTPGSGKSTWITNHINSSKEIWISRDEVRFSMVAEDEEYFSKEKAVFREYIRRINEALDNEMDVFADATHLNKASRNKLLRAINPKATPEVDVIWIKTPLSECIYRNDNRKGTRSFVPRSVIRRMFYQIEKPEFEEGFDTIYIIEDGQPIQILKNMEVSEDVLSIN